MSDRFGKLAERQMQKALAEKKVLWPRGEGRPLPDRPEAAFVDAGEAVGYRIMHEHGALPGEIALRKAVEAAKGRLRQGRNARGQADGHGSDRRVADEGR